MGKARRKSQGPYLILCTLRACRRFGRRAVVVWRAAREGRACLRTCIGQPRTYVRYCAGTCPEGPHHLATQLCCSPCECGSQCIAVHGSTSCQQRVPVMKAPKSPRAWRLGPPSPKAFGSPGAHSTSWHQYQQASHTAPSASVARQPSRCLQGTTVHIMMLHHALCKPVTRSSEARPCTRTMVA